MKEQSMKKHAIILKHETENRTFSEEENQFHDFEKHTKYHI